VAKLFSRINISDSSEKSFSKVGLCDEKGHGIFTPKNSKHCKVQNGRVSMTVLSYLPCLLSLYPV
jgi:hypothetical protein